MHIAIILIVLVISIYLSKPLDKESYYKAVFSIFGIVIFFVWRFLSYYAEIFEWNEVSASIALFALMLTTTLVCVTPWLNRITFIPSLLLVGLFIVSMMFTFIMENQVKNRLAQIGNYFSDGSLFENINTASYKTRQYSSQEWRYTIDLPEAWQEKQHKSGLTYFVKTIAGKKVAELLPGCFHTASTSIPEIVINRYNSNRMKKMATGKDCFLTRNNDYACMIKARSRQSGAVIKERWDWVKSSKWGSDSLGIGFVFYRDDQASREEALSISQSLAALPESAPLEHCITIMEWL